MGAELELTELESSLPTLLWLSVLARDIRPLGGAPKPNPIFEASMPAIREASPVLRRLLDALGEAVGASGSGAAFVCVCVSGSS